MPPDSNVPLLSIAGQTESRLLEIGGDTRKYVAHLPQNYTALETVPVVVMLHAGGSSAKAAIAQTQWDKKADEAGFLAVFPEALPQPIVRDGEPRMFAMWNDGSGRARRSIDDVAFIAAVLDDIEARYRVDSGRVFLSGFAAGASMAFRATREMASRIAALGVVSGHLWADSAEMARPVPLVCLLGTEDHVNPIRAGWVRMTSVINTPKPQVRTSVQKWARALGLPESSLEYLGDGVFRERWGPDAAASEALFYIVEGLGLKWPVGPTDPGEDRPGTSRCIVSATDLIWDFFLEHGARTA